MGFLSNLKNDKIVEYTGGHPEIDKPSKVRLRAEKKSILIKGMAIGNTGKVIGEISGEKIKNILVENKSTVSRRVTVGRLLLVGVFAFAWKKKKTDNEYYVVVEWNDGRFDHETLFEFEGKGAQKDANEFRNYLIKGI